MNIIIYSNNISSKRYGMSKYPLWIHLYIPCHIVDFLQRFVFMSSGFESPCSRFVKELYPDSKSRLKREATLQNAWKVRFTGRLNLSQATSVCVGKSKVIVTGICAGWPFEKKNRLSDSFRRYLLDYVAGFRPVHLQYETYVGRVSWVGVSK